MKITLPDWLKEKDVLDLVNKEFSASRDKVQLKLDRLNERKKLYMNIENQDEKVYVRMIYSVVQTLIGLYYKDSPTVKFMGRQLGDDAYAENLSNLQKFDYDEMGLPEKRYYVQWDKFMSGVGIEVLSGWDSVTKTPKFKVMSPESRYPDVEFDVNNGYRYHGFELIASKHEFAGKKGFFNTGKIKNVDQMKVQKMIDQEIQKGYTEEQSKANIDAKDNRLLQVLEDGRNDVISIYQHYTRIKGIPYIFTLANDKSLLIRAERIKAVFTEEGKDAGYIDFPIIIRNWSPLKGDPWGVSVPDILEDKQKAAQLFLYLNKVKAENEAWGDMFLYDPNVIENIGDLQMPGTGPRFLAANLTQGGTPLMEVPKAQIKSDSFQMGALLVQQGESDVGVDDALRGISPGSARTATEHQRVQKNANLRLLLGSRIDGWAEKKFWRLWYRSYYENFKRDDKKNIYLNNGLGQISYVVQKKDFTTKGDLDIKIISLSELREIEENQRVSFWAIAAPVLQNPDSKYSKAYTLRKLFKLNGMSEEETYIMVPESAEEIQAKMDVQLLNRGIDVWDLTNLQEDHATYLAIYQSALEGPAKQRAIQMRRKALVASGQQLAQQQAMQEQAGGGSLDNMSSQMTSNMLQRSNTSNAASLQDITA